MTFLAPLHLDGEMREIEAREGLAIGAGLTRRRRDDGDDTASLATTKRPHVEVPTTISTPIIAAVRSTTS